MHEHHSVSGAHTGLRSACASTTYTELHERLQPTVLPLLLLNKVKRVLKGIHLSWGEGKGVGERERCVDGEPSWDVNVSSLLRMVMDGMCTCPNEPSEETSTPRHLRHAYRRLQNSHFGV